MNIGSRLKQILAERDMTVSQLSRTSGIPAQTLYAMINRDSNKADMDIMAKMLVALDMDFMEFLEMETRSGKTAKPKKKKEIMQVHNKEKTSEDAAEDARKEPERQSYRRELEDYLL